MFNHHTVLTSDGARLAAYVRPGGRDDAPTVVLAHGWTNTHRVWHKVVDALGPDLRIVLWDQRGHGDSTLAGGTHRSRGESIERLGEDLREVIRALVPDAAPLLLAGHSMGGMTVLAYVAEASPAELQRLRGVVLCSTAAADLRGAGLPGEARIMRTLARLPTRTRIGRLVQEKRQRAYVFGNEASAEDVSLTTELTGGTRLVTYGAFYGAMMLHDKTAALAKLAETPTTILVGTHDKLTPRVLAGRMHDALPSAQLQVLDGRGHLVPLEEPSAVVEAINTRLSAPRVN
ncbi:alpha/beta fold hydrolase [Calidifontibacter terrae]